MKTCPTCQGSYPSDYAVCPQDGSPLQDVGVWVEGSVIRGKYRILSKVGQGGMGAVYKALHLAFDEVRALKVIAPEILHDELIVRRFKHEAVITRKLQHPNAVRVDDIDEAEDGRPFIVMEFIQGKSLKKVIHEEGPLPVPRVCSITKQAAAALDAAHRLGMVHRDIKPDNIALVETAEGERVKILDFGIAKMKEARADAKSTTTLTGMGMVIGTPQYMSPEQAMGKRGDELDGRSDLYSLGIVMYEMLTGELPFQAETTMGMLMAHLQQQPRPILTLRPDVQIPWPIADLVMRLLEKKPAQRPASAQALIKGIEAGEKGIAPLGPTRIVQPSELGSPEPIRAASETARPAPGAGQAVGASGFAPAPAPPVQPQFVTPGPPAPAVMPTPVQNLESGILDSAARAPAPAVMPTPVRNLESGILDSAARAPAPAVMPTPQPRKQSRWGIWVGIATLLVGLGGGGSYVVFRRPSSVSPIPVSTPSGQGGGPSQQTPSPPPVHEQSPIVPESAQGKTRGSTTEVSTPSGQGGGTSQQIPGPPPVHEQNPRVPESAQGKTPGGQGVQPESAPTASGTPTSGVSVPRAGPAASAVDPRKIKAAITEGDFLFSKYRYDDAIKAYEEGLKLDPSNAELRQKLERAKNVKATEERVLH